MLAVPGELWGGWLGILLFRGVLLGAEGLRFLQIPTWLGGVVWFSFVNLWKTIAVAPFGRVISRMGTVSSSSVKHSRGARMQGTLSRKTRLVPSGLLILGLQTVIRSGRP